MHHNPHGSLRPASRSVRVALRSQSGLPLGPCAGCLEVLSRDALRSHVQVASRSQGTNFETNILNSRCFLALPTKTSFSTPHYYPKYEVRAIEFFCGRIPLNPIFIF